MVGRVLILEDEKKWRDRLKKELVQNDYEVETVENPDKAASVLEKRPFDALVVDVQMSVWNKEDKRGLDLLERVPKTALPAAVVVSGRADKADVRRAFRELRVIDVIEKFPFNKKEYLRAVREAVTRTRERRSEQS